MRRLVVTFLSVIALLATGVVAGFAIGGTGTIKPPPRVAFLANGINPADALAAGPIAGRFGAPLFTTPPDSLSPAAAQGIKDYAPDLIIALGGPVALTNDVLIELRDATELALLPDNDDTPTDGIVRVFGESRYDTAAAVAGLLGAYSPAFLPVDATALGAVEAATAETAEDADLLDGIDSDDYLQPGPITILSREWQGFGGFSDNPDTAFDETTPPTPVLNYGDGIRLVNPSDAQFTFAFNVPDLPLDSASTRPNLEILSVETCVAFDGGVDDLGRMAITVYDRTTLTAENGSLTSSVDWVPDGDRCQTFTPDGPLVIDDTAMVAFFVSIKPGVTISMRSVNWTVQPTADAATPIVAGGRTVGNNPWDE